MIFGPRQSILIPYARWLRGRALLGQNPVACHGILGPGLALGCIPLIAGFILGLALFPAFASWSTEPAEETAPVLSMGGGPPVPGPEGDKVIKRIPKLEMYPCDDCHSTSKDFNPTKRILNEEHTDKKLHFAAKEGVEERWCHNCHLEGNYKKLILQSGREINFNESYLICGECHGDLLNKWNKNAHGKRVGLWNGPREVYSCPECHDPHDPKFKPMDTKKTSVPPVNTFWVL
ncbi:MAG: hypothetical protein A2048_07310 [Deltaproteobacteria bacterium GWA2_45_12]|nr:MAG: hypothetical protein A2048_07310 [Deltaproteobacteria bacterium GWA2_45_12]